MLLSNDKAYLYTLAHIFSDNTIDDALQPLREKKAGWYAVHLSFIG